MKYKSSSGNLGDSSQEVTCDYCQKNIWTILLPRTTYLTYLISLIVLLIFGFWISLLLIPCALIFTQTLFHVCPNCRNEIGTNSRIFNHFFLEDKVISLKIFEFGIILTRKIVLGVVLCLILAMISFLKINALTETHPIKKIPFMFDSWETFIEKCSPDLLSLNSAFCAEKYLDKSVYNWEGYVIRVIDHRENFINFYHHAVEIFVHMNPSESNPDILLTFDSGEVDKFANIFNSLDRGEQIIFNGSIKNFGGFGKGRHIHGISIKKGEKKMEIQEKFFAKGRYGNFRKKT